MYMAPEVIMQDYGPPADLWSVGMLMYQLLTGTFPFWDSVQNISLQQVRAYASTGDAAEVKPSWYVSARAWTLWSSFYAAEPSGVLDTPKAHDTCQPDPIGGIQGQLQLRRMRLSSALGANASKLFSSSTPLWAEVLWDCECRCGRPS